MPADFSLIIPTYNRPARTQRAIASVLAQSVQPAEIIVVDDGSDTPFAYDAPPDHLRVLHLPANRGPSAARNAGLRAAQSRWVTFLDSDDQLLAGTLAPRVAELGTDPQIIHACGWSQRQQGAADIMGRYMPEPSQSADDFFGAIWFCPGSCIFIDRQAFLDQVGLWDETLTRYEDYDWFCRAALGGFTLRITDIVGTEIERARSLQPARARQNTRRLLQIWQERPHSARQRRLMRAYLAYEVAAAAYFSKGYLPFAAAMLRSFALWPRRSVPVLRRVRKIGGA